MFGGKIIMKASQVQTPVLIVHGFADVTGMWARLVSPLQNAGFHPLIFRYPTLENQLDVPEIADSLFTFVQQEVGAESFQIVGHSQGGLIAEWLDLFCRPVGLRRVVTIATPFQGNSLPLIAPRVLLKHWPFSRNQLLGLSTFSPVLQRLLNARWTRKTPTQWFSFIGQLASGKIESDGVVAVCEGRRRSWVYVRKDKHFVELARAEPSDERILRRNHLPPSWLKQSTRFVPDLLQVLAGQSPPPHRRLPQRQACLIVHHAFLDQLQLRPAFRKLLARPTLDGRHHVLFGEVDSPAVVSCGGDPIAVTPGHATYIIAADLVS